MDFRLETLTGTTDLGVLQLLGRAEPPTGTASAPGPGAHPTPHRDARTRRAQSNLDAGGRDLLPGTVNSECGSAG